MFKKCISLRNVVVIATCLAITTMFSGCDPEETLREFTVTFETNNGSAVATLTVKEGEKLKKPTDPTRDGYSFAAWFKEAALTTEWKFDADVVTSDMTLYAKWNAITYTILFDSNEGSTVASQTIAHGDIIAEPAKPSRDGFIFGGWYTDNNKFENLWEFASAVTANFTLYAHWYVQLLKSGCSADGLHRTEYEYDNMNRITKIYQYGGEEISKNLVIYENTFTYNSEGDVVSQNRKSDVHGQNFTIIYSRTGNKILFGGNENEYAELDGELLVKYSYESSWEDDDGKLGKNTWLQTYEYQNANLTKHTRGSKTIYDGITYSESTNINTYTSYDDKKTPFYCCKTPKWILIFFNPAWFSSGYIQNNWLAMDSKDTWGNTTSTNTYTYDDADFPLTAKSVYKSDGYPPGESEYIFTYIKK